MSTKFIKINGHIVKDTATGKPVAVSAVDKLALILGKQDATNNPYFITAEDLEGVTEIGDYAFHRKNGLTSVQLPNSITSLGNYAFGNCSNLTSVEMLNVAEIGDSAFYYCSKLTSANMPNATIIGDSAFESCKALTSVNIPNVTSIATEGFYRCSALTAIDMPNVTSLGNYALDSCSNLTSVNMPKIITIGDYLFRTGVSNLTSLTIPATCTKIGQYALHCGSSTNKCTFTFLGTTPPTIAGESFKADKLNKIIVPKGCGETYKTATNWTTFASYIVEAEE